MKRTTALFVPLALALVLFPGLAPAQETAEEKYRSIETAETVTIQDAKGVVTEASGFSKLYSTPNLSAFRGASTIEIPFDRIQTVVTSPAKDNRMPLEVVLRSGRRMNVLVDRPEYESMYGGSAEFGYFRIRLQDIRTLTFRRTKQGGEGQGQRSPKGHIYYNDAWHFCPYDGEKLTAISPEK